MHRLIALQGHSRSLILAPIESACDFLLVIIVTLALFSRFRDNAGFLLKRATLLIFHPNFWDVPLGLHVDCRVMASRSEDPKLMIRAITFELIQHIHPPSTVQQRHGQTDGQATYDSNTALAHRAVKIS